MSREIQLQKRMHDKIGFQFLGLLSNHIANGIFYYVNKINTCCLVTNNHCLKKCIYYDVSEKNIFRMRYVNNIGDTNVIDINVDDTSIRTVPGIDICFILVGSLGKCYNGYCSFFDIYPIIRSDNIPLFRDVKDSVDENVVSMGYVSDLIEENTIYIHRGYVSRNPRENEESYVCFLPSHTGMSGSPIFIKKDKKYIFLGLLKSIPRHRDVIKIDGEDIPIIKSSNYCNVIPSSELMLLEKYM